MKTNAIIRIVIFSLVILLLLGVLLAGLGIGMFILDFDSGYSTSTEAFTSGGGTIDPDDIENKIENIDVEWASGSVLIYPADVEAIEIHEAGNISEGQEMVYAINEKTLKIHYSKPSIKIGFFSTPKKDLTIVVPNGWLCDKLSIDAASADISLRNFEGITVDIDTASGDNSFQNCSISNVDIDTASGDVSYVGHVTDLDCDSASADITAVLTSLPNSVSIDTASGDLDLTLPESNNGFSVKIDSLSGKFTSEFETTMRGDAYIYKNGTCDIEIDGASGDITIRKGS